MICSSSISAGSMARVTWSAGTGAGAPGAWVSGRRSMTARARSSRPPSLITAVRSSSANRPDGLRWVRSTSGHSQATAVRPAGSTGCWTT